MMMDVARLGALVLTGTDGARHRVGDLWDQRPVVLVFLRHFGCLLCREHAAQLREHYEQIQALGGEVVAVGTGDERYAKAFVADDAIPFPVLLDDDGAAAQAASVRTIPFLQLLFDPRSWPGGVRARRAGFRIHRSGQRVTQLGATFVIGPGPTVRYAHIDRHSADHAPLDAVLGSVRG
jgi:peroxiredoxin